ncbi:MAG TPA: response regulator, partial [Chloroflexota bacterium]|nr:response regulator [Chloroflexota bacterium]
MTTRILVIDDEATIRELVAEALREADYDVATAANGAVAWQLLGSWVPDVIVLDLMMPQLGGHGLVELLRGDARLARIPVLVVTATYGAMDEARLLEAQACLTKPFALEDLLAQVAALAGEAELG